VANSPQARKRAKQNTVRRLRNHSQRSAQAKEAFQASASMIDKATVKGLHHKNRAARLKSRLNKRVKEMAA